MEPEDAFNQIENRLYHLRVTKDVTPCVVEIQVKNIGTWIVKIRRNGVIVNDSNLICADCTDLDATVIFRTPENFWAVASNATTVNDDGGSHNYIHTGDAECVNRLFSLFSQHNSKRSDSKRRKSAKDKVSDGTKSIKSGWLHKKRDIIAGWRHRYFKIYMGRAEYFIDQHAVVPRGVIPLLGAEVVGPMRCSLNGNDDHWCLTVDPRHRDKSFKLASDHSGVEGNADIESWIQALTTASRSTENHTGMLTTSPTALPSSPASPRPGGAASAAMASIPRRLAAAATSLARSSSRSDNKTEMTPAKSEEEQSDRSHDDGGRTARGANDIWRIGEGSLKYDVIAVGLIAAIVGANISFGSVLSGWFWTLTVVLISVALLVKIIYDFYQCTYSQRK